MQVFNIRAKFWYKITLVVLYTKISALNNVFLNLILTNFFLHRIPQMSFHHENFTTLAILHMFVAHFFRLFYFFTIFNGF